MTAEQFGTPIRKFVASLVEARQSDIEKLRVDIRRYVDQFMAAVHLDCSDGLAHRRAKVFGLAYAASQLARRWQTLPPKKKVGDYLLAFKEAWSWAQDRDGAGLVLSPVNKLKVYVKCNKSSFKKATLLRKMSDSIFQRCPGFTKKAQGGGTELLMSPAKFRKEFGFDRKALNELIANGILIGENGAKKRNNTKRSVRRDNSGSPVDDRVFVIRLNKLGS